MAIKSSVLFSTLSDFDVCTRLNPDRYADVQGLLAVYKRPSSPQMLATVAQKIEALPPDDWVAATTAAHVVLCQIQREGANDTRETDCRRCGTDIFGRVLRPDRDQISARGVVQIRCALPTAR